MRNITGDLRWLTGHGTCAFPNSGTALQRPGAVTQPKTQSAKPPLPSVSLIPCCTGQVHVTRPVPRVQAPAAPCFPDAFHRFPAFHAYPTHTLSPRMQYTPGFWMTCTPDCGGREEHAREAVRQSRHVSPCSTWSGLPGVPEQQRPARRVHQHSMEAKQHIAQPRAHHTRRPLRTAIGLSQSTTVAPHATKALPSQYGTKYGRGIVRGTAGPHLCAVHSLLALLQQQVGRLVVAAQDALRRGRQRSAAVTAVQRSYYEPHEHLMKTWQGVLLQSIGCCTAALCACTPLRAA